MKILGEIVYQTMPPIIVHTDKQYEIWGEAIIKELKKHGYYIAKVKGDPSGRW